MFLTGKKCILVCSFLVAAHIGLAYLATKISQQELGIYVISGLLTVPLHLLYLIIIFYSCQRLWNFSSCLKKK